PPGRLLLISPHLDDAVLACGDLLATRPGALVVTVCAGTPRDSARRTDWDAACGFAGAGEAMARRRAEDAQALAVLGARPRWLPWLDDQYAGDPALPDPAGCPVEQAMARDLHEAIVSFDAELVLCPLGLFHRDHHRVHEAALRVLREEPRRSWFAYEDVPYRRIPGLVQQRLMALAQGRIVATPAPAAGHAADDKARAVECYASQLRGLAAPGRLGHADALAPEGYWALRAAE